MIGSWRWNAVLGSIGGFLTMFASLGSNGLAISAIRFLYAFIAFFIIAYVFRAVIAAILRPPAAPDGQSLTGDQDEESKGRRVDYSTPDESDELSDMLKQQLDGKPPVNQTTEQQPQFKPLQPEKLVSTQNRDPEEIAKAIRHLTGE
ncbi:flagellar biosynthesis/type III secretory pathway M-ring protein FliF/YscJ [Paenibacillus phyllosphaerae]|uniref:Flagellar biosynthesis/type III secretory pathway M-ring protein FliF/YscJ n=1 Tax=Paenibacillus phyllosphaerae TaxID=274593 RepID=A0A7W5AWI5_9BACL|nr:hypothetical protein [Paenibacillus phyllosphaerae]MBB3109416.1 flagellar biosynthesis/type III secretory pathway M-ring protein FliF/YscJ [Paenibacillus phyllosphaerae]